MRCDSPLRFLVISGAGLLTLLATSAMTPTEGRANDEVWIHTYDATMADHSSAGERRAWASRVCGRLEAHGLAGNELVILEDTCPGGFWNKAEILSGGKIGTRSHLFAAGCSPDQDNPCHLRPHFASGSAAAGENFPGISPL